MTIWLLLNTTTHLKLTCRRLNSCYPYTSLHVPNPNKTPSSNTSRCSSPKSRLIFDPKTYEFYLSPFSSTALNSGLKHTRFGLIIWISYLPTSFAKPWNSWKGICLILFMIGQPAKCLVYNKHSINICWMHEWIQMISEMSRLQSRYTWQLLSQQTKSLECSDGISFGRHFILDT